MKTDNFIHRQGLLALIVAQIAVVSLHSSRLPLWILLLALLTLIWRVQIYRNLWSFPNALLRLVLVLSSVVALVAWYREWYSLEPMVMLLITAFLLKLLEVNTGRDALVLIYVGFVVSASAFLFAQGIVTTLAGVITLWLLTACLLIVQARRLTFFSRYSLTTTASLLLQAVPLMLLMLVVFPRIGALWSVPLQSGAAVTGVSDSMAPGDFSQLSRSRKLAFRVSFVDEKIPGPAGRYWRGPVLTDFDGRRWTRLKSSVSLSELQSNSARDLPLPDYQYEVVLEPTNNRWLYAIPVADIRGIETRRTATDEVLSTEPLTRRIKYRAASTFTRATKVSTVEAEETLRQALLLPRGFNPKTLARARQWRNASGSDSDYIQRVLQFYNNEFFYTLSAPVLGANSVDEFLFSTQTGFCEHFASSFVVLMRAVGIPARVVTGYQGGEWNPVDRYLTVRQYDAHAWAEVWLAGRGWVRFDPTAAVAPDRIERGLFESLTPEDRGLVDSGRLATFSWISTLSWANSLASRWSALNYRWQRWVLDYDEDRQSELLQDLLGQVTPFRLALLLVVPAATLLTIFAFVTLRTAGRPLPASIRVYRLFTTQLKKRGVRGESGDTLNQLGAKALRQLPAKSAEIDTIVRILNRLLYDSLFRFDKDNYRALKARIRSL